LRPVCGAGSCALVFSICESALCLLHATETAETLGLRLLSEANKVGPRAEFGSFWRD
jgi:hypothetical protein